MRIRSLISAIVLALTLSTAGYCADKTPAFAWQTATAAKVSATAKTPSEAYYHRTAAYLKSVTLTADQQTKVAALQKAAAADIDNPETHKKATAAYHASVLALLTPEQLKTVHEAHKRPSKAVKGGDSDK